MLPPVAFTAAVLLVAIAPGNASWRNDPAGRTPATDPPAARAARTAECPASPAVECPRSTLPRSPAPPHGTVTVVPPPQR